ncbi:Gfo/Idh/MocA family oxidoreductase [Salegentibacter sp. F188]|uniref:Gfo/Idh/MocA family oxidoreductase n=1 Tax=Autumnicola patrickiae TaxID=3075591 RepID=A0ABU3E1D3_9FLAO|nr:Gfo/Idh/MocA family oxidoreductase [Salegentibacter sp. F188]MDT0689810.1 Gfo/Idh/MocA family oxidoreductase [Salegentibacter sp. F188]
MGKKLRIGVIGMSEGNGHPYSWSAIFNGYNPEAMKDCPFPVIPDYLAKQDFPEDSLGKYGEVTHIWTQNKKISEHIAAASKISNVVDNLEDMVGAVDAILLARDDAENHKQMAEPFIKAGLPVFIDKPFALSIEDAEEMLSWRTYDTQIYSCSAIRFAEELKLNKEEKEELGSIQYVEASIGKYWDTYAIHVLEPIVAQFPERGQLVQVKSIRNGDIHQGLVQWENLNAYIKVTGKVKSPFAITFYGDESSITKKFSSTFASFKRSLYEFVHQVINKEQRIELEETLELVKIIEQGRV